MGTALLGAMATKPDASTELAASVPDAAATDAKQDVEASTVQDSAAIKEAARMLESPSRGVSSSKKRRTSEAGVVEGC